MAKKMKRKTLVGLLVVSSIVAVGGVLGLVEGTSGALSKTFEEENYAEYNYTLGHNLKAELTDDSTLTQKVDLSTDTKSPFKKAVYNFNLYGDEDAGILSEDETTHFAKNCSKLEIKLTLKDDVDFYISHLSAFSFYAANDYIEIDSADEGLNLRAKVGRRDFVTYSNQSFFLAASQNAYSGDIVITITNDKAKEKEDSIFFIPDIRFNFLESNDWTATAG